MIAELPADDPNSFFAIGGLHGEPFELRPTEERPYWGGWCNHGNVLFPTWHRAYCHRIEKALQSAVPGVGLPFFDQTSASAFRDGIPHILTDEYVELDGIKIKNPLRSFILPEELKDEYPPDDFIYRKPKNYETVRYPYSGLVGTPEAEEETAIHNAQFTPEQATTLLNQNFDAWLNGINDDEENNPGGSPTPENPNPSYNGVFHQYANCLTAPNYTVFSNTTSAEEWASTHGGYTFPVEGPHNDVHLAIGGYSFQSDTLGQIEGANGDMGENNTAGLDPIFFFHHCNIDRMFWLWQVRQGFTEELTIIPGYPGTSSNDGGPTVGQEFDEELSMTTELKPFVKLDDPSSFMTSEDVVNIEKLGYKFGPGSFDEVALLRYPLLNIPREISLAKKFRVTGISREKFRGSFVIYAYAVMDDLEEYLGHYSVLGRWDVKKCANCQSHLQVNPFFSLGRRSSKYYSQNGTIGLRIQFQAKEPKTGRRTIMAASSEDYQFSVVF